MPAAIAALRARFIPAVPAVSTVPMITSSISAPSMPARRTAWRIAWPISVGDLMLLSAPRNARPIGVRAVDTMTASLMASFPSIDSFRIGAPGTRCPAAPQLRLAPRRDRPRADS